jgi:hypothetical protein
MKRSSEQESLIRRPLRVLGVLRVSAVNGFARKLTAEIAQSFRRLVERYGLVQQDPRIQRLRQFDCRQQAQVL